MKFIKTKKGYCLLAVILVIFLTWFLSGLKIETVDQHNEKLSKESNERQSILAELLDKEEDTTEENTTPEAEGSTLADSELEVQSTGETGGFEETEATGNMENSGESTSVREPEAGISEVITTSAEVVTQEQTTAQNVTKPENVTKTPVTEPEKITAPETTTKQESTTEPETTTKQEENKYYLVNIKISCENVIGHKDLNTSADLPEDGIILDTQTVVKKGETVLDALEAACTDYGISLVNEDSGYGAYILAIGGLAEMECGRYSGWKYKVNGEVKSVSCSSYTLEENDEIIWYFATDYK